MRKIMCPTIRRTPEYNFSFVGGTGFEPNITCSQCDETHLLPLLYFYIFLKTTENV
jgi:hypothetical protein